jgi:hypothetical protein
MDIGKCEIPHAHKNLSVWFHDHFSFDSIICLSSSFYLRDINDCSSSSLWIFFFVYSISFYCLICLLIVKILVAFEYCFDFACWLFLVDLLNCIHMHFCICLLI